MVANAITIKRVSKSFGLKKALDGVSFSVNKGEIFGFLGPNGAGKTTTIRILMDFVRADNGTIKVFGLDSRAEALAIKQKIGYLPADYYHYKNWTGQEHIDFVCKLRDCQFDKALVKAFDLDIHAKVKHLSTGNQQKLALILALLGKPEILVLDEPTRGLDPILQNQFYDMLHDFKRSGGTVFMSSHNLAEVQKICDSIAVIRDGKLAVEETLQSLRNKSIHVIEVSFIKPFDPSKLKNPNVELIGSTARSVSLRVKGEIDPALQIISRQKVKDIEIRHASLEELFLELYK